MVSIEAQSILRRKAALGTQEHEARAMSVAKAMRQSIAKLGKELLEVVLVFRPFCSLVKVDHGFISGC